jgi:hypothetical protein
MFALSCKSPYPMLVWSTQRLEYGAIVRDDIQDPVLFSFESDVTKRGENRAPTSEQCVIRGISSEGVCGRLDCSALLSFPAMF